MSHAHGCRCITLCAVIGLYLSMWCVFTYHGRSTNTTRPPARAALPPPAALAARCARPSCSWSSSDSSSSLPALSFSSLPSRQLLSLSPLSCVLSSSSYSNVSPPACPHGDGIICCQSSINAFTSSASIDRRRARTKHTHIPTHPYITSSNLWGHSRLKSEMTDAHRIGFRFDQQRPTAGFEDYATDHC